MHATTLLSGADTMLFMFPFLAMMAMVVLRLDEHIATPKNGRARTAGKGGRIFCEMSRNGQTFLTDPDGRPCHS
jgi:hypothetical protein